MKPFFVCVTTDEYFAKHGINRGERLLFNINLKTKVTDIVTENDLVITDIKPIEILRHTTLVMNNGLLHSNKKLSARANNLLAGAADGGDRKSSGARSSVKANTRKLQDNSERQKI